MSRTLKPLADRVVAKRVEKENVSAGGIILTGRAIEKSLEAVVVEVGPGSRDKKTGKITPLNVSVGDRILIGKGAGTEVKINNDETLLVLPINEILAIVK